MLQSPRATAQLKRYAAELGFSLVGVVPATPSPRLAAYLRWITNGMHGSMAYLARPDRIARRQNMETILPSARSLILVGVNYAAHPIPEAWLNDPSRGRIASYAWGQDYHTVLTPQLEALAGWLRESSQQSQHRVYVDTGAILERSHAQQAGLGFIGKNTMLINPRQGSYLFLGEILTTQQFDHYDQPLRETMCGTCTRCIQACPTAAFPQPYVLDARRCISYLTIEHKGWIDRELRPLMGNWIMGCDVCQAVCPFQRFATPTTAPAFSQTDLNRMVPSLLDLLTMDQAQFEATYRASPVARLKRERLVRNACVAAGNWGSPAASPALAALLHDASPLIRGHAAWALGRIGGSERSLRAALTNEPDLIVVEEIHAALHATPA